jgi:hypothetical protein
MKRLLVFLKHLFSRKPAVDLLAFDLEGLV